MCTTFLLPFAMGACEGVKGNLMVEAFGIVAMVAMTPLIVIQLMGLIYKMRTKEADVMARQQTAVITAADRVIDWGKITVLGE